MSGQHSNGAGRIRAARLLITMGAERYVPDRHLVRLLPEGLEEIWKEGAEGRARVVERLRRELRAERRRGRAGH